MWKMDFFLYQLSIIYFCSFYIVLFIIILYFVLRNDLNLESLSFWTEINVYEKNLNKNFFILIIVCTTYPHQVTFCNIFRNRSHFSFQSLFRPYLDI